VWYPDGKRTDASERADRLINGRLRHAQRVIVLSSYSYYNSATHESYNSGTHERVSGAGPSQITKCYRQTATFLLKPFNL